MGGMAPALTRQKITFGEMRAGGVRGLLIYCSDYRCSHWTAISGDRWPDSVRMSDIEPRFTLAKPAASEALMSARISIGNRKPDEQCRPDA
jgi:hypothetical protein